MNVPTVKGIECTLKIMNSYVNDRVTKRQGITVIRPHWELGPNNKQTYMGVRLRDRNVQGVISLSGVSILQYSLL